MEVTTQNKPTMKEQRLFGFSSIKDEKEIWLTATVEDNFPDTVNENTSAQFFNPFKLHFGVRHVDENGKQSLETISSRVMTISELLRLSDNIQYFKEVFPQDEVAAFYQADKEFKERQQQSNGSDK